jgi:hypothetical protein
LPIVTFRSGYEKGPGHAPRAFFQFSRGAGQLTAVLRLVRLIRGGEAGVVGLLHLLRDAIRMGGERGGDGKSQNKSDFFHGRKSLVGRGVFAAVQILYDDMKKYGTSVDIRSFIIETHDYRPLYHVPSNSRRDA